MKHVIGLAAAAAASALLAWSPAAAGARAAPPGAIGAIGALQPVQFRFPWESRPKAKPRARRSARPQKPRGQKPAAARRGKAKTPVAAPAAPADPLDAALPPPKTPLDVAPPRGATQREADGWAAVAREAPPPDEAPRLTERGPGAQAAAALVLLAPLRVGDQTASSARTAAVDEDETPDRHVPLPPVRPPEAGAGRQGLEPDGRALAPEGQGLAPEPVPLPPRRPPGDVAAKDLAALEPETPEPPPGPTAPDIALPVVPHDDDPDCRALASEGFAETERIPPIEGPGVCGGGPLVTLTGVRRPDGGLVKLRPAATLRCSMARALAAYLREEIAPAAQAADLALERLDIAGSFQCRGRNGASGGKMSEHGRANAIDLSGFGFADGRTLGVFAAELPRPMTDRLKSSACERFSTVLGPGSDGHHESHLHLDLQPRRSKSKLCQWSDPEVAKAKQDSEAEETDRDSAQGGKSAPPDQKAESRRKAKTEGDAPRTEAP